MISHVTKSPFKVTRDQARVTSHVTRDLVEFRTPRLRCYNVDVLSIAVGPKCGPYELCVEGESVNKCNKDLECVSICAVKPDEDGSFVASKVKDDSAG